MKTKIAIVGTGGVGGFIGGLLARHYETSDQVEIYFISRGKALANIREKGLIVDSKAGNFTARPRMATDSAAEIGEMDYVFFCTKAYDVEQGISEIRPCIGKDTVVLPFLNGVDSVEKIREMLPGNEVWDGCVYVVAYIVAPGHIAENTNGYLYLYGSPTGTPAKLARLDEIFSETDIRARRAEDIEVRVWNKFAFISTVATITSYTDETYGGVLSDMEYKEDLLSLLIEFRTVAMAKDKVLSPSILDDVIAQMERIPPSTTTSMQRDFRAGRRTELESLTGYIVREGRRLNVPVPTYERMYDSLKERTTEE